MMLECMISAYTPAALSLEGSKKLRKANDNEITIMIAGLAFTYSAPVKEMHPERPLRSLFHPAVFLSTLGQAAIHLYCMVHAVNLATSTMGEDRLAEVKEFNRKVRAGEAVQAKKEEEMDMTQQMFALWAQPFLPNLDEFRYFPGGNCSNYCGTLCKLQGTTLDDWHKDGESSLVSFNLCLHCRSWRVCMAG